MKMKLLTLGLAAALAVGSVGIAYAVPVNLVTNGDFSQTTNGTNTPTQFGTQSAYGFTAHQFISGWKGNDGYEMWYPNPTVAVSTDAHSVWGQGSNHDTGLEKLWGPIAAPPDGTLTFVGMDGDQLKDGQGNQVEGSIRQKLTGLTNGATYTVSFDWAAGQLQSRSGPTQTKLEVSFGGQSLPTPVVNNPSDSFSGWYSTSLSFMAHSTSAVLKFLSVGSPNSLPPMALLTNVSVVRAVPEPAELGMFGVGLVGLGVLTMVGYRRKQRLDGAGGDGDNA